MGIFQTATLFKLPDATDDEVVAAVAEANRQWEAEIVRIYGRLFPESHGVSAKFVANVLHGQRIFAVLSGSGTLTGDANYIGRRLSRLVREGRVVIPGRNWESRRYALPEAPDELFTQASR